MVREVGEERVGSVVGFLKWHELGKINILQQTGSTKRQEPLRTGQYPRVDRWYIEAGTSDDNVLFHYSNRPEGCDS